MKNSQTDSLPFWERPLDTLNNDEWEQLCDGCSRCCLKKLSFEEQKETHYTRVACRYLDETSSRCRSYQNRSELVPDCVDLNAVKIENVPWLPDTCAYRLRHENKPLFWWHPLISGSRHEMVQAGISVQGKVISEEYVHEDGLEEHIIRWVSCA